MSNQKDIIVYSEQLGRYGESAVGFLEWFQSVLNDIPEEFRSSAMVVFNTAHGYDSAEPGIEIRYTRPMTSEEIQEQAGIELMRRVRREHDLLNELARLRKG